MKRIAIIAAFPDELRPLVAGWRRESRDGVHLWRLSHGAVEWVAACAGVGADAATRAFAQIERLGAVDSVLSTGWAGALREDIATGRAYRVSEVVDAGTGERFRVSDRPQACLLVTSPQIAHAQEKRRLASAYAASLVDMEAAAVARLAAARGVPFRCVKGVSDALADQLPDLNGFISSDGQFHLVRFALFAMLRPWHWPALVRMGGNSRKAAHGIRESLLEILDEQGTITKPDGPP
jgi:adenosylhomocysteine nucleosidase